MPTLSEPFWLVLLVLAAWPFLRERSRPRLSWPTLDGFAATGPGRLARLATLPNLFLALAIAGMVVALARPRSVGGQIRIAARGAAIVVAIDRSPSMDAPDFPDAPGSPASKTTRLDAAKRTLLRFLDGRPEDRIGVVAFARYPDLTCPPTLDHAFARDAVGSLSRAVGPDAGTNLGDALIVGLDALRKAPAAPGGRALVLLSDGHHDPGLADAVPPEEAARLCRDFGVTLHTFAIGDAGGLIRTPDPASGLPIPSEVGGPDLPRLAEIARLGGGRAFRATDAKALDAVFAEIDALSTTPEVGTILTRYREDFPPWALASLALLALHRRLRDGRLARLP